MDQLIGNEIATGRLVLNYKKHDKAYAAGIKYLAGKGITKTLPVFDGSNYYIYYVL